MSRKSFQLQKNCWFNHQQLNHQQLPAHVRDWLLDSGSLTARLIVASNDRFSVKVLSQCWARPSIDEARMLAMKAGQVALIRETALLSGDETWVYARSVLPLNSLQGRLRHLRSLKNSSLGALLFKDPFMHRSPFQVVLMSPDKLPAIPNTSIDKDLALWGRRSCFYLDNKPLLVSEIFLPGFQSKK